MATLSVVIITLNAAHTLRRCLASLPAHHELIVLDSGSSDATTTIAAEFHARISTRTFDNYAAQKNHAISLAQAEWILSLDADEELSSELRQSIAELLSSLSPQHSAYRVPRALVFLGKRMRFGKTTDEPLRLFRRGSGAFQEDIHERFVPKTGSIGLMHGKLWHHSYRDLSDYFARFNVYTSRIAAQHHAKGKPAPAPLLHFLRPWAEFFSRYILRLGFLDGRAGYTYALTSSLYTYIKYEKLHELSTARKDPS